MYLRSGRVPFSGRRVFERSALRKSSANAARGRNSFAWLGNLHGSTGLGIFSF